MGKGLCSSLVMATLMLRFRSSVIYREESQYPLDNILETLTGKTTRLNMRERQQREETGLASSITQPAPAFPLMDQMITSGRACAFMLPTVAEAGTPQGGCRCGEERDVMHGLRLL
jgi:hypothetical protein